MKIKFDNLQLFNDWVQENVIEVETNVYSTQDALYRNRLKGRISLMRYYIKEFGLIR